MQGTNSNAWRSLINLVSDMAGNILNKTGRSVMFLEQLVGELSTQANLTELNYREIKGFLFLIASMNNKISMFKNNSEIVFVW